MLLVLMVSPPLLPQGPSLYQIDFNKDYITWMWDARISATIKTGRLGKATVANRFISTLFRQTAQIDKWRDENTFGFSWNTPLSFLLQPRTLVESRMLSDENANREFAKHLAAQEFALNLHAKIRLIPGLGYAMEKAFNSRDEGLYYRLGLDITKLDLGGYYNYSDVRSNVYNFPGRKNQDHSFFTAFTKQFSDYASDSLRVGYQFSESRYYINPGSGGLEAPQEQVIINARFLFNTLQYQVSERSLFSILTNFRNRDIDQSNPFQESNRIRKELAIENQFEYLLFFGSFTFLNSLFTSLTENDNNPGLRTDIQTLQSAFNSHLRFQLSPADRLWGRFSYTKLAYNTPDIYEGIEDDPALREDRDEQRFIFDAGYRRNLSPYFAISFSGNVYLFHQIYLRSLRSQNNNWNQIYQLAVGADHKAGEAIDHRNQIKILANYTVFDFEELFPNVRSFVFRKLIYNDTLGIRLTKNLSLNNIYQWEKEDNGTFYSQDFTQQVTKELIAHYLNIYFQHDKVFGLRVIAGVAFFFRDEWSFSANREKQKVREFRSITPRLTVVYPAGKRLLLYLSYAPNRATNFGLFEQYYTSGVINLKYFF